MNDWTLVTFLCYSWSLEDILLAVESSQTLKKSINYLKCECITCFETFPRHMVCVFLQVHTDVYSAIIQYFVLLVVHVLVFYSIIYASYSTAHTVPLMRSAQTFIWNFLIFYSVMI